MYNYRLTKRGKAVLSLSIVMVLCLVYLGVFQIVNAENKRKALQKENITAGLNNIDLPAANEDTKTDIQVTAAPADSSKDVQAVMKKTSTVNDKSNDSKTTGVLKVPVEKIYDDSEAKIVFLTFDDGPSKNISPQILNILKENNVQATFFVLGKYADINKDIIKNIYSDGNAIGIHGYSHVYSSIYKDSQSFQDEIERTGNILRGVLGNSFKTRLFRFPGGSTGGIYNDSKDKYKSVLKNMNFVYVDWNVVIGDAEAKNSGDPKALYDRFISTIKNKKHVVLLMHDSSTKQETADILPKVIEYLKAQGYEFGILE